MAKPLRVQALRRIRSRLQISVPLHSPWPRRSWVLLRVALGPFRVIRTTEVITSDRRDVTVFR
ncbi:hypothetical protein MLP_02440 [Microlunatus phosphovorus NM-1]|uniref:Uncharacterized protein n=1 Tax=Microlunatus phosphovorus (strain ATCC 700054 / DSM 10555 / JCM 9379 / NBRC 101784 / NCIMB 13414 / VKM Ac-1990 / NM-1) TaxID=1032480 RepID=F5XHW3_MICPN|nr:hypothetical protein [Microlunatus phosphovorus]BAK33258.1 hypothetical protein MLP_02440 [Microlunatus phosphovorus NM-1]